MRRLLIAWSLFVIGLCASPAYSQPMSTITIPVVAATPAPDAQPAPQPTAPPATVQLVVPPVQATAQQVEEADVLGSSVMILVELFVLAVVLESALALLFTWLPFRTIFNGQGVKPIVSFAAALALTGLFHTEILAKVVESYGGMHDHASDFLGRIIDSMIIAGGSSGVHTMLQKLGIRLPNGIDDGKPVPPPSKAWLAIVLTRRQAKGPVQVEIAPVVGDAPPAWALSGTINGARRVTGAAQYFLRDYGRFPTADGWAIDPGIVYLIRLTGFDANGNAIASAPYGPLAFATGAVVDIELTL